MTRHLFIGTVVTLSALFISTSALATLDSTELKTVNHTHYLQFCYQATSYGAAFTHKPSNPYNGNGYFSGTDGVRSFVGEVTLYPVASIDKRYKCEVEFFGNGYYQIEAVPTAGYTCTVSTIKRGVKSLLQLTLAQ